MVIFSQAYIESDFFLKPVVLPLCWPLERIHADGAFSLASVSTNYTVYALLSLGLLQTINLFLCPCFPVEAAEIKHVTSLFQRIYTWKPLLL